MEVAGETPGRTLRRIWGRLDDATWRTGAYLRLRTDPLAGLVPATFRRDGMFITGRNGRMFLARDSSHLLDQHSGRLQITPAQLDAWRGLLERRVAALAARDCAYLMLIAPNAHSVYPEDLPARVRTAPERPVHRLLSHLSEHDLSRHVVYPLAELLERKRRREVYPRTESHWNELGAFVVYQSIAAALGLDAPMRRLIEDEVWFFELVGPGDLGVKRRLPRKSPHLFGYPRHPTARLVDDNLVENTGSVITTECAVAPETKCVVLGDSNAYGLLPFLAESFRRTVFAQTAALDAGLVQREQPDVVLTVISERFLLEVPDVPGEPGVEEQATAKLAAGRTRSRMERWDWPRPVSPAEVEWIRARMLAEGRLFDATVVSVMAYAGLAPGDVHALRWRHVGPDVLMLPPRLSRDGATGTPRPARRIRLLEPLARDLAEWRAATPEPHDAALVFPSPNGGWGQGAWRRWCDERYVPLAERLSLESTGPGALSRTFVALSIHAGATPAALAVELGQDPEEANALYAQRVADAARAGHVPAQEEIVRARRLAARTQASVPAGSG